MIKLLAEFLTICLIFGIGYALLVFGYILEMPQ